VERLSLVNTRYLVPQAHSSPDELACAIPHKCGEAVDAARCALDACLQPSRVAVIAAREDAG